MKITKVDLIPVDIPRAKSLTLAHYGNLGQGGNYEFVLVRIQTDEGITGVGEVPPLPPLSPESQPVIIDVQKKWLVPAILGMDPFEIEEIWKRMDFIAPTYSMAKAAIDMALWDIMGKSLGMPVHRLLGGSKPEKISNVGLIGIDDPEVVAQVASEFVDDGYKGIRLKIAPGYDVQSVRAIRDTIGGGIDLRVDCNQGYQVSEAVKMIRNIEPYGVEMVEQPTIWWDFKGLAEVAASVDTPIMAHESMYLRSDVKNLLDAGAIGVLGLKTYRPWGGITGARRLLEMARVLNIPCMFHDDLELSVSLAAATQIISAYRNVITHKCELSGYPEWMGDDVVVNPIRYEKGFVYVPEGSGLGVELDNDKVNRYTKGILSLN
jgi:L-alanine-DL-glutamate epimerase-like enolase superfamily enzyme